MKKPIIHIVFNVPGDTDSVAFGAEADADTWESVDEIKIVLTQGGYQVNLVPVLRNSLDVIRKLKNGVIFNLIEWTGKDIIYTKKAMALFEKTGLPYTGSNFEGLFMSTNKILMKKEFIRLGIPTPKYQIFETGKEEIRTDFDYPVIVKPALEHCGIGVSQSSVLESRSDLLFKVQEYLQLYKQPVLAEEYIDGRELNVSILEDKLRPLVLSPVEVIFNPGQGERPIYTYEAKWKDDQDVFKGVGVQLAKINEETRRQIEKIARRIYLNMGGGDYPRLDIRLRGEEIFVLEVNINPEIDFTFQGGLGMSVKSMGLSYLQFLDHVIKNVVYRFESTKYERARI